VQALDNVVSFPDRRGGARNAEALSVLAVLQDQLALARSGKLRSIALASMSSDGEAIVTRCSCASADLGDLAEMLHALADEMIGDGSASARTA
jgi:hypothetical protein